MYDVGTTARIVGGKIVLLSGEQLEVRAQTDADETAVQHVVSVIEVANATGVPQLAAGLAAAGFDTAVAIRDAAEDELTAVDGVGPKTAVKLKTAAEELLV